MIIEGRVMHQTIIYNLCKIADVLKCLIRSLVKLIPRRDESLRISKETVSPPWSDKCGYFLRVIQFDF